VEVRRLEWRRLGFGIANSFLYFNPEYSKATLGSVAVPGAEISQTAPAIVDGRRATVTVPLILVLSANGTYTFTCLRADDLHGQRQKDDLTQNIVQGETISFVKANVDG
jgi:hypothetical protein